MVSLDVMIAFGPLPHISIGLLVLFLLPFAFGRWLVRQGLGFHLVFLGAAFGQVLVGLLKSGQSLSDVQAAWFAAGALVIFVIGGSWMVYKAKSSRRADLSIR